MVVEGDGEIKDTVAESEALSRKVGHSFVGQYYKILAEKTSVINNFYNGESRLCLMCNEKVDEVKGDVKIRDTFIELGFGDMEFEIKNASSLPCHGNGVMVFVSGLFTSKNKVLRKISQTFLLVRNPVTGSFVVLNDVLVVVDGPNFTQQDKSSEEKNAPKPMMNGVANPTSETNKVEEEQVSAPENTIPSPVVEDDKQKKKDEVKEQPKKEVVKVEKGKEESNSSSQQKEKPKKDNQQKKNIKPQPTPQNNNNEKKVDHGDKKKKKNNNPKKQQPQQQQSTEEVTTPEEPKQENSSFSYAQMLTKKSATATAAPVPPPTNNKANTSGKQMTNGKPAPGQQQQQQQQQQKSAGQKKDGKKDPKANGIYVRDLPKECNEEKLRDFFKKYGKITAVDYGNKGFAFVYFEQQQNVQKILSETKLTMDGKEISCELRTSGVGRSRGRGGKGRGGGNAGQQNNNKATNNHSNSNQNRRGGTGKSRGGGKAGTKESRS